MAIPTYYPPRAYRTRVSTYWWLRSWPYLRFILRELSSISVAWFVLVTLLQLGALHRGPAEYARFGEWLRSPLLIAGNAVALFFLLFHAITWFNLAPKAMAVRIRGKRVPPLFITVPNYIAWLAASLFVAFVLLRG